MMNLIKCCKDCTERHECCHADCERYLAEKALNDAAEKRAKEYAEMRSVRTYSHRPELFEKQMRKLGR